MLRLQVLSNFQFEFTQEIRINSDLFLSKQWFTSNSEKEETNPTLYTFKYVITELHNQMCYKNIIAINYC